MHDCFWSIQEIMFNAICVILIFEDVLTNVRAKSWLVSMAEYTNFIEMNGQLFKAKVWKWQSQKSLCLK